MPINAIQPTSAACPDAQPGQGPAPSPHQRTPIAPSDRIARSEPDAADDYTAALHRFAGTADTIAARGPSFAANAAPEVGEAALGSAKILGGALAGTAAVLLSPTPAGNADEASPGASWRAASNAASDRATFMAAHAPETAATTLPADASKGVQHTGHTAPTVPKTDMLHTPIDSRSGTAHVTPAHTEPSSLVGAHTPIADSATPADHATLAVNAHDLVRSYSGWTVEQKSVTKTDPSAARTQFDNGARKQYVRDLANKHPDELSNAGITDGEIANMKRTGNPPRYFDVHHIVSLGQGGSNDASNLILIHRQPEHTAISGQQNSAMSGMRIGESKVIDVLVPPAGVSVFRAPQSMEAAK